LYIPVKAFLYDGTDLYAGTSYGVYISTNNGSTWSGFNNGFYSAISVTSLAIGGNWIYAGTEGDGLWKHPYSPSGVREIIKDQPNSLIYQIP